MWWAARAKTMSKYIYIFLGAVVFISISISSYLYRQNKQQAIEISSLIVAGMQKDKIIDDNNKALVERNERLNKEQMKYEETKRKLENVTVDDCYNRALPGYVFMFLRENLHYYK